MLRQAAIGFSQIKSAYGLNYAVTDHMVGLNKND
jgi:hypothetical protein